MSDRQAKRVEAAARAICRLHGDNWDDEDDWQNCTDDATAALAAADAIEPSQDKLLEEYKRTAADPTL